MLKPVKTIDLEVLQPGGAHSTVPQLSERSERIRVYHTGCRRSAEMQIIYGFLCGLELNAAKAELAHGNKAKGDGFMKWREANHPEITHSTANRYMAVADALQEKLRTVRNFEIPDLTSRLYITNGDLPETEKKLVLEAVHEVTDATTISQLYRELDIVKKPKSRAEAKRPEKKDLTPDEQAAALQQQAHDAIDLVIGDLAAIDADILSHAINPKRTELFDALLTATKMVRSLTKTIRREGRRSTAPHTPRPKSETRNHKS